MLCALDMSVHSTHIVYDVECPCRRLHTLVTGLSAVAQIALHWCAVTDLALCLVFDSCHGRVIQNQQYLYP